MPHATGPQPSAQAPGEGNNANWWTAEDRQRFEERANKLVAQADEYAPLPQYPPAAE